MRRVLIGLLIVLAAGMAFLLLDFRLAKSTTVAESTFGSASNNSPAPQTPLPIYLWIEEKDSLSTGLRDALSDGLRATGRFDPQVLATAKPGAADFPLLRVWVERPGLSWTPFYAQADMQIRFGFSTYSSEIDFKDDAPMQVPSGDFALYGEGDLHLRDQSFGLISLRGYWDYLAEQAAAKVVEEVGRVMR